MSEGVWLDASFKLRGYVVSFVRLEKKCLPGFAPIDEMFFCVLPDGTDVVTVYCGVDKISLFVEISYFEITFAEEMDSSKAGPSRGAGFFYTGFASFREIDWI